MIEVEYDHADRSSIHDQARSGKECVVCKEVSPFDEYGFKLKTRGSFQFHYNLFCPECGDRTIHKDPISNLVFRFHVQK